MIRDVQGDDVEVYITDDTEKRILISNYHPIFKLEVSQLEEDVVKVEQPEEENKITIITDKNIEVNTEQTIAIQIEGFGGTKYRKKGSSYIKLNSPIWGYYYNKDFFSDYKYTTSLLSQNNSDKTLFIDYETQDQYIIINNKVVEVTDIIPGQLSDGSFTPFFTNYDDYPDLVETIDATESTEVLDLTNDFLDEDATFTDTNIFITYDNLVQLKIKTGINQKTVHTAQFPYLVTGSIIYKCVFTDPGLYTLEVSFTNNDKTKKQSFDINVVEQNKIKEVISIDNNEPDEDEEILYVPNKIGNKIINPRINRPTNLKVSLNSLILDNNYIKDLLNSNRSNVIFTSPTDRNYQIYKYESHNIYDDNHQIIDTWFFINADFIDEYIELHILPTYINAMDNVILLSDNDIINHFYPTSSSYGVSSVPLSFTEDNEDDEEYKKIIDNNDIYYITNVPTCSNPKWLIPNYYKDLENYTISFDCYSSYYYRSIFYINDLEIYGEDNKVYLKYLDSIDVLSYNLLDKGIHSIEFSVYDKITLGIDGYIISSDIFDMIQPLNLLDVRIGFQQVKRDKFMIEALAADDVDGYTYITNSYVKDSSNTPNKPRDDISTYNFTSKDGIYKFLFDNTTISNADAVKIKSLPRLEIDLIRRGAGSNIVGVIDKTNKDPYDQTTLLDYHQINSSSQQNTHSPIQYNNTNERSFFDTVNSSGTLVIDLSGTILNIESIDPLQKITKDDNVVQYDYTSNDKNTIIQTLKYFNDDLYSESYNQLTSTLSDALSLITNKQYYNQHWRDKEEEGVYEYYYGVTFDDETE